ncbi:MAG: ABC transporter permease [Candidatus Eremiobacteraeota bacterium]|nr:ABC transporter permease [Candidatus Eremiobacteraeota bacterium]MBV8339063.1 ABC transporter permease [Candidatus Eremiobacteraeota bacterium]MBV8459923.1 ABC transporter permease [Candidatus Eremiobacteraeota bacterium]MBV8668159.1 ABC transporter permease [Candidatus Eremiobacteraeota bacterium]MBV8671576.1 ABC transporter permease [Candidatus Eremiobacteraeota bacterium]
MRPALDFSGFAAILYKEVIHVTRDRLTLILAVALPVVQMTIFGYAVNMRVEHIGAAYLDEDRGPLAVRALDAMRASQQFDFAIVARSREDLRRLIVRDKVKAAFDIPPNFSADVGSGRGAQIQVLIDGSDSNVAQQAYAAATTIGSALSTEFGQGTTLEPQLVDVRPRMLFNPSLRSANFFVPGLVGVIMQLITVFLMSLSIVGERERGTLDQLLVTPIGVMGLMLGKIMPYAAISMLDFFAVLAAMVFIFGVPIAGSFTLLVVLAFAFLLVALGLGLMISSIARTQAQAVLMTFAITLPSILLSGFVFERDLMPVVLQWLGYAIPLTYFLEILRGIVLRGAGVADLWPSIVAMLALGVFLLTVSSVRFARRAA